MTKKKVNKKEQAVDNSAEFVQETVVEQKEETVETIEKIETQDVVEEEKVWVENWRELVQVENSKDHGLKKLYYGVKKQS